MTKRAISQRLVPLCARLEAMQEESISPARVAQLLRAEGFIRSEVGSSSCSEHPLADILRQDAPAPIVEYMASAESSGLGTKALHFLSRELSRASPSSSSEWLVSVELAMVFIIALLFGAFVLPSYEAVFRNFRAELPGLTLLMSHAYSPTEPFLYVVLSLLVLAMAWRHTSLLLGPLAAIVDRFVFSLPFVGTKLRESNGDALAGWLGHLGSIAEGSAALALKGAQSIRGQGIVTRSLHRLSVRTSRGSTMREALQTTPDFDRGVAAAWKAASEDPSFDLAAAMRARWRAAYVLKPERRARGTVIAQMIIGIVIALTVIAMYLPLFQLGSFF